MHIVMYCIYHMYAQAHSYLASIHGLCMKYLYTEIPHMLSLGLHNEHYQEEESLCSHECVPQQMGICAA